jgi:hypothetical protein
MSVLLASALLLIATTAEAQIIILRPPTYMGQPNPLSEWEKNWNETSIKQ